MKTSLTRARLGALAAVTVAASSSVLAATYSWQTAGTTNNWSTAPGDTNWFIDAGVVLSPWADANDAVLAGAAGENIVLSGTVAPTSTTVNDNGNWTLSGTGVLGGSGSLTKNGAGTLTIANTVANIFSGGTTISSGTLSLGTGGTTADTTTVSALGTGTVAVNSGTLRLWIRNNAAFTIANNLNVNGGSILNEDGNYTLSGTVSVGAGGATLRSKWTGKNLTLTNVISGIGAVTVARPVDGLGNVDSAVILTNSNSHGGGTTVNSAVLQLGNAIATDKGPTGVIRGTLTVNSPGSAVLGFVNALGYAAGQKVDTFNINGATVTHTASGDQGWGVTYNMTGGTLQSTGTGRFTFGANTSVNTLASTSTATIGGFVRIREGNTGNTINFTTADGAAPVDLTVNAVIEQSAAGYGITKLGAGVMLLNAVNTYAGNTNVNAGTLVLGQTGSIAASPVVVNAGAFVSTVAGKTLTTLTANNGSTLGLVAAPGATTNVTGALNLADGATISVSPILGATTVGGTYDLVTAGSITGTGTPVLAFGGVYGPSRATGSVAVVGNKLQLTVTGTGASLLWNNAAGAGAATGTWDTNVTANFNNGGNDVFQAFDSVTFDDTVAAGVAKTVNVAGTVAPALVSVNNSAGNNYNLSAAIAGAGLLAGSPSIVKSGTGSLILGANLGYGGTGGEFTVSGGTFDLGAKVLPTQAKLTLDGGSTLSNGTLPVSGSFDFRQGTVSAVLNGAGTFTKTTGGTVILSGNSAITGAGTITAGTLQVGAGAAAGSLGTGAVSVSPGATFAFNRNDSGLTVANAISGAGALAFNGTNNGDAGGGIGNGLSSYALSGNNSGFSGAITVTNSRIILDNANDIGTAPVTTGTNGALLITAGTYPNAFTLAGNGWGEPTGLLGALRIQGGIVSGPITLAGNTRITSHSGAGTISGPIGESGGPRNLELGGSGTATNVNTVLTLSGASTYTGTTSIGTAGSRTASVTLTGSLASSAVTVNNGSTLNGNGSIAGSLNFAGAATNLGVNLALPGTLTVAGATTFGGVTTVALTPFPGLTPGGSATLMTYGSATGAPANFAIASPASYRQAVFTVGATALSVDIGSKALLWTGTGGLTWDIATTANWTDTTPAASAYYQGDVVTFDDTAGAANAAVAVAAAITPSTVTVNNSASVPYTFSGAGSVGGGASLVKQGDGTMTVLMAMPYIGGTTVSGGSFIVDGNQQANRQGIGNTVTVAGGALFEVRGVNSLPTGANAINATLQPGAIFRVVTGTSASTGVTIPSHGHVNNLTLNGGVVDFTYSGTGLIYNAESIQLNGILTVGGSAASTIQSLEPAANQGLSLIGNRTFAVADATSSTATDLLVTAELENSDNNSGALTKTGDGTLELAAANSYTAGTTVSTGTLLANNGITGSATGTGAVSVATGATLGGSGGATGAVTAAGTLSPGTAAAPFGVLRTGATTLTGSYACQIDGTSADVLAVTGNLNLSGATLALAATGAGANQTSYILATWTGTRTAAFGSVTGLPAGYAVVYDDTLRQVRLEQSDGYSAWETANGITGAGSGTDSDSDGIPNGIEFVIGGDPSGPGSSSSGLLPTVTVDATYLNFAFRLTDASAYLDPFVEYGSSLAGWTEAESGVSGVIVNVDNDFFAAGTDRVTVRIPRSLAVDARLFARLRVDVP